MTLDYVPGRVWQGQVDFIYPTLDAITRTLKVRLRFNNEDEVLKPNMYAEVKVTAYDDIEALVVPVEAVIRTGGSDRVVLALGEGKFKSIEVQLGRHFDDYIEITAGIKAGDVIVSSAQFLIDSESSKSSDFLRMSNQQETASDQNHEEMDHSKMDHSKMKPAKKNHTEVDHSKMDHSQMGHDDSTQESQQ
jgi:Cu(I)/Ag(I) efflux system membrane fusion protein